MGCSRAQFAAYPLLGLAAGVWIDRWSRRRTMIVADIARGIALISIPLAARMHALSLAQLIGVALVVGTMLTPGIRTLPARS